MCILGYPVYRSEKEGERERERERERATEREKETACTLGVIWVSEKGGERERERKRERKREREREIERDSVHSCVAGLSFRERGEHLWTSLEIRSGQNGLQREIVCTVGNV